MPDNKKLKGPKDDKRVADDELSYWSKKWGVKPAHIRAAKKIVGDSAVAIEKHLKGAGLLKQKNVA